jgi:hypothetical protein
MDRSGLGVDASLVRKQSGRVKNVAQFTSSSGCEVNAGGARSYAAYRLGVTYQPES